MCVILATQEASGRRVIVQGWHQAKTQDPIQKKKYKKAKMCCRHGSRNRASA
jgi:hypothetical protein